MVFVDDATQDQNADPRDPDMLMRQAELDRTLFQLGVDVDIYGLAVVLRLVGKGYPRTVAMRMEIQREWAS